MNLFTSIDLETGDLTQFGSTVSGTDYALSVATAAKKNGSYGLRAAATSASDTNTSACGIKTVSSPSGDITVAEGWFQFSAWTSGGYNGAASKSLLVLRSNTTFHVAWLAVRGTRLVELGYQNSAYSSVASGFTLTMTLNTWYLLRIVHSRSAGSVTFKHSTDGVNFTTVGTVASGVRTDAIDEIRTGIVHVNQWEKARYTVDVDDVAAYDAEPAAPTRTPAGLIVAQPAFSPVVARPQPQLFGRPRRTTRRASARILVAQTLPRPVIPTPAAIFTGAPRGATASAVSASDTGAASDLASGVAASAAASDAGALADASSGIDISGSVDTGAFGEASAVAILQPVATSDSGVLSDTSATVLSSSRSDSGALADTSTLLAASSVSDGGNLGESSALQTGVNHAAGDAASAIDAAFVAVSAARSDAGTLADSGALQADVGAADSGTFAEAVALPASATANDGGALSESISLQVVQFVAASDAGTLAETAGVAATPNAADAASGADTSVLVPALVRNDAGASGEACVVDAALSPVDAAASADAGYVLAACGAVDTGVLAEAVAGTASATASDAGTLGESVALSVTLVASDVGVFAELVLISAVLTAGDAGIGRERSALAIHALKAKSLLVTRAVMGQGRGHAKITTVRDRGGRVPRMRKR